MLQENATPGGISGGLKPPEGKADKPSLEPAGQAKSILDETTTRVLKTGDLARISSGKHGKLKDHDGDLGRIVRATSVGPTLTNSHPFVYDLVLILGGKLNGVERAYLRYTTATQEGMTGDARARRKRKQTVVQETPSATNNAKKAKASEKKKRKPAAPKNQTKKRTSNTKTKGPTKKAKSPPVEDTAVPISNAMDMYERHRREFERSLARLEKSDVYGFFCGDVPPEFEEDYSSPNCEEEELRDLDNKPNAESPCTTEKKTAALHESLTTYPGGEHTATVSLSENGVEEAPPNESVTQAKKQKAKKASKVTQPEFPTTPPYNFAIIRKRMENGRYVLDRVALENDERIQLLAPYFKAMGKKQRKGRRSAIPVLNEKGINWGIFRKDVLGMCDAALARNPSLVTLDDGAGTLPHAAKKICELLDQIYEKNGRRHDTEMAAANDRHRFSLAMDGTFNKEAAMQGKWRREAFPERHYERLKTDAVCAGLSELDERIATYELRTTLKDSFVGLAYTYDDTGQSEGWMKSILDEAGEQSEQQKAALAIASDDGVIKAQVAASMQTLMIGVQDKVMTDQGVLDQRELRSANWVAEAEKAEPKQVPSDEMSSMSSPEIVEQPVWGIDCYTRRNISICLETEFDPQIVLQFVEKWLLPAINACPEDLAYDLTNAARLLEGVPLDASTSLMNENGTTTEQWSSSLLGTSLKNKMSKSGPPWLKAVASTLRRARQSLGPDFFRVHPKGHGSIVLCDKLEPNRLVTFYRGEVYPSWRWGEKTDAISLIQERKGLKPVLPDFFNMALERPQVDPRGYGLLFVDASRKSGYGSMLSHSCQPSCEVRVVAVNGELKLAMTTLREMTVGDELTFDYNAVTESLLEYRSAVCLCGHGQCRGSFLHFATADCYQQVLNRNSPIAVRLANLIKGCTKKVMSEDDDRILKRHGFQTAAFGAISVNRRKATNMDSTNLNMDSMECVPVWLRTYVADTLRYIEYERRALPIALICNDLFDGSSRDNKSQQTGPTDSTHPSIDAPSTVEDDDKPIKGSKPEPTFFFYSRVERERFLSLLMDDIANKTLSGIELKREVQKLASTHWKLLDEQARLTWKEKAYEDWERNGGREKARLEEERVQRVARLKKPTSTKDVKVNKAKSDTRESSKARAEKEVTTKPKMSFQQADSEGVSAMEQRIQQLTQSLSRVGRVLDRHREETLRRSHCKEEQLSPPTSDDSLRELVHAPLVIMPDEHVVAWMWNHEDGVVPLLLKYAQTDVCVSPGLREALQNTVVKHEVLKGFGAPWDADSTSSEEEHPLTPTEGRRRLNEALLELRQVLLDGMQQMASDIKKHKAAVRKEAARKKKLDESQATDCAPSENTLSTRNAVEKVMGDLLVAVENRFKEQSQDSATCAEKTSCALVANKDTGATSSDKQEARVSDSMAGQMELDPWLQNFNKRFKIEKAADLLLMYASTTTFFSIKPHQQLKSTPIQVYARELGNSVPVSAIDCSKGSHTNGSNNASDVDSATRTEEDGNGSDGTPGGVETGTRSSKQPKRRFCDPEDIVSDVVVEYQGDYVLSQLLQWYNAGIGQKSGLPDILGCVLLPSMYGCWTIDGTTVNNSHTDRTTRYQSTVRRRLIDWFKDPLSRGSPWPDDIRKAFVGKDEDSPINDSSNKWLPIGSPILDFLVTGDDFSTNAVVQTLSAFHSTTQASGRPVGDGLLSSVDQGRPAQAVSNWVQCENPGCLKWRRVPWHIDIDMLSEKFLCTDNFWDPSSASCDAPEDEWDASADAQVGADGSAVQIEPIPEESNLSEMEVSSANNITGFKLGDNGKWDVATVVKLDLAGPTKRVLIHYSKMQVALDEWIEIDSLRLAVLHSHTKSDTLVKPKAASRRKRAVKDSLSASLSTVKPSEKQEATVRSENSSAEDASESGLEEPSNIDDAAMASVFVQDSDEEEEPPKPGNTHTVVKASAVAQSRENGEEARATMSPQDSAEVETTSDTHALVDSDDERPTIRRKRRFHAVTDDSSPEESQLKTKPNSPSGDRNVWTIPKKKVPTNPASLIQSSPTATEGASTLTRANEESDGCKGKGSSSAKSGSRIPRKTHSIEKQSSLLSNLPEKGPQPFQIKRVSSSHAAKERDTSVVPARKQQGPSMGSPSSRSHTSGGRDGARPSGRGRSPNKDESYVHDTKGRPRGENKHDNHTDRRGRSHDPSSPSGYNVSRPTRRDRHYSDRYSRGDCGPRDREYSSSDSRYYREWSRHDEPYRSSDYDRYDSRHRDRLSRDSPRYDRYDDYHRDVPRYDRYNDVHEDSPRHDRDDDRHRGGSYREYRGSEYRNGHTYTSSRQYDDYESSRRSPSNREKQRHDGHRGARYDHSRSEYERSPPRRHNRQRSRDR